MIVVDTNIICYRYMASRHSEAANAAWARDSHWIVPFLWRSEFRNVLAGAMRRRSITVESAIEIANLAEAALAEKRVLYFCFRSFATCFPVGLFGL